MLVLTRKYQEKIRIGDNIIITVLRTKGKAVRLGIEAPADVPVIRGELLFEPAVAGEPAAASPAAPETTTNESIATGRTSSRRAIDTPLWETESPHRPGDRAHDSQPISQVGLRRVSRDKVGQILPQLVPGAAPLRAMMNQR